jgi:hypothetical protein
MTFPLNDGFLLKPGRSIQPFHPLDHGRSDGLRLLRHERMARVGNDLDRDTLEKGMSHWIAAFDAAGVPAGPINTKLGAALRYDTSLARTVSELVIFVTAKA